LDTIIELCYKRGLLKFQNSSNQIEMGYVAHLGRLAELILSITDKNETMREQLDDSTGWVEFVKLYLRPRIERRSGALCRG